MKDLGFRHGWESARSALGWLWPGAALLGALGVVLGAAMVEAQSSLGASAAEADLVRGVAFGLLLPLACFALSARLDTGLDGLMNAVWVRHGAERRAFALGRLAFPMALGGGIVLMGGSLALALSHAIGAPAGELPVEVALHWLELIVIAGLGAASYVAGLGLAQLLAGAWGRASFLVGDWLLGSGQGVLALPWPRASVRTLLGGDAVAGMGAASGAGWLTLLTALCLFLYLRRVPR
jgi:hypothetical protein